MLSWSGGLIHTIMIYSGQEYYTLIDFSLTEYVIKLIKGLIECGQMDKNAKLANTLLLKEYILQELWVPIKK